MCVGYTIYIVPTLGKAFYYFNTIINVIKKTDRYSACVSHILPLPPAVIGWGFFIAFFEVLI